MSLTRLGSFVALGLMTASLGCGTAKPETEKKAQATVTPPTPPPILVDGSSTVDPISRAVLDLYASRLISDINLGVSGTGGGFKKFCRGKTAINGASRPITSNEVKLCAEHEIEFIELPVAFDGVAVVVPRSNDWVGSLTVKELHQIWSNDSEKHVVNWKDVRRSFPDQPLALYGPGIDSGTFDFFTKAVNGEEGSSRSDYTASEDDNELVGSVARDAGALGYFGLAYYHRNDSILRVIPIDDEDEDNGAGPIEPTPETVATSTYQPLSRPLFIYVNRAEAERTEVEEFVAFYLRSARLVAPDVGYVGLPRDIFTLATQRFESRKTGTAFAGGGAVLKLTLGDLLQTDAETPVQEADSAKSQRMPLPDSQPAEDGSD